MGFGGVAPDTSANFYSFFQKILLILGLVLTKFRWLNKMLMRPQGLRPGARVPTCPPLVTPLGAKAKTVHLLSLLFYRSLTLNLNVLT